MRAESKSPERSVRERERERRSREMGRNQQRANPINRTQSAAQVRAIGSDQMKKAQEKLTLFKIDFLSSVITIGLD